MLEGQSQVITRFRNEFDTEDMLCMWGLDPDIGGNNWTPDPTFAHTMYDQMAPHFLAIMTNQYHFVGVVWELAVPGGVMSAVWDEDQEGDVAVDAVPQNTAFLIHKYTDGVGVGKHGRCYIPGVREDNVSSAGRLEDDYNDTVSDAMTELLLEFNGTDLPTMVVNRGLRVDPTDPPPRVPSIEPDPLFWDVQSLACDPYVATQRRRLRR